MSQPTRKGAGSDASASSSAGDTKGAAATRQTAGGGAAVGSSSSSAAAGRALSPTPVSARSSTPQSPPATPQQKAEWGDSIENLSRLAMSADEGDQLTVLEPATIFFSL